MIRLQKPPAYDYRIREHHCALLLQPALLFPTRNCEERRGLAHRDVPLAIAWVPSLYMRSERANQKPGFFNPTDRAFTSSRTKPQHWTLRLTGPWGENPTAFRKNCGFSSQPLFPGRGIGPQHGGGCFVLKDRAARNNESHRDSAISIVFNLLCSSAVEQQHLDPF